MKALLTIYLFIITCVITILSIHNLAMVPGIDQAVLFLESHVIVSNPLKYFAVIWFIEHL